MAIGQYPDYARAPEADCMSALTDALWLAWLLVPGFLANMTPVFAMRAFPRWTTPIDYGMTLAGKPLLGKNKTWRGLISGVVVAVVVAGIQSTLTPNYPYWLVWGFLIGFGALLGDAVKSFFKRRMGIPPGKPFIP